jgi:hypothetical protein
VGRALPLASIPLAGATVAAQLTALAAADFAPRERATFAEVLRDLIAHLHTELARRYAGKAQPAAERELEAAEQAIALWQGLWEQYSTCPSRCRGRPGCRASSPDPPARGLYVGKQLVLVHGLARRAVPGVVARVRAYYRREMLECAVRRLRQAGARGLSYAQQRETEGPVI